MAPPLGKGSYLAAQEQTSTPEPTKKPRDTSRPDQPATTTYVDTSHGRLETATVPTQIKTPKAQPIPALQQYGVNMDINQVNQHVNEIAAAHLKKWGYNPTPGLVFDLLKANGIVGKINYGDLFGVPSSLREARTDFAARTLGGGSIGNLPIIQPKVGDLIKGLTKAVQLDQKQNGSFHKDFLGTQIGNDPANQNAIAFWKAYQPEFEQAFEDPKQRDNLMKGLMQAAPYSPWAARLNPTSSREFAQRDFARMKLNELHQAGIGPPPAALRFFTKAGAQIVNSTADMPYGFYMFAKSLGVDSYDLVNSAQTIAIGGTPNHSPLDIIVHGKTSKLAVQVAKQAYQDVLDPVDRPGYLLMDIWGAASLAAGVGGRAAAVARGGPLKGIVTRIPAEHTDLAYGSYHAALPLSDTMIVRILQKHTPVVGRIARQKRLEAMHTHGYDDTEVPTVEQLGGGSMRMIARQKTRDRKIEIAVVMTPVVEMHRLNRWSAQARDAIKTMDTSRLNKSEKLAMDKAVQLIFTDDPDPIGVWRSFHQREAQRLAQEQGDLIHGHVAEKLAEAGGEDLAPSEAKATAAQVLAENRDLRSKHTELQHQYDAHLGQLEAINLAEKMIANPAPRFKKFIDRAYEASASAEHIKKVTLGLDESIAEQHIAEMGATLRGEHVIDLGDGKKGIIDEPIDNLLSELERAQLRHKNSKNRLEKAKATERIRPTVATAEDKKLFNDYMDYQSKIGEKGDGPGIKAMEAKSRRMRGDLQARGIDLVTGEKNPANVADSELSRATNLHGIRERQLALLTARHEAVKATARPLERVVSATGKRDMIDVYHGSTVGFKDLRAGMGENPGLLGDRGVYVTTDPKVAEGYTKFATRGGRGEQPNIRIHQIDNSTIFNLDESKIDPDLRARISAALPPVARHHFDNSATSGTHKAIWAELKSALGEQLKEERILDPTIRKPPGYIKNEAGKILESLGFTGIRLPFVAGEGGDHTLIFDPKNAPVKYDPAVDKRVTALREDTPGSAHFPTQPLKYKQSRSPTYRLTKGRYGVPPKKDFPFKAWTGRAFQMGDFRFDMTQLLGEQLEGAYRSATVYTQWRDLWDAAVKGDTPPSSRHRPIRDIKAAPAELKALVTALERQTFDQGTMKSLKGDSLQKLHDFLYNVEGVDNKHVRWVDENLIMDKVGKRDTEFWRQLDDLVGTAMTPINEPMRLALIFATPAYLLNALGSTALLAIHQGFAAPVNLGRSMIAHHLYGPEVTRLLDRLAGQTHASSFVSEANKLTRGSRAFQEAWQILTDTHFRRAAVINELKREGLLDDKLSKEELYQQLTNIDDKGIQKKINLAAQRGRKAMLDFDSMTWPERAIMRHIFFVYTFVRASGVWSLRYLRDHGAQAAFLAQAGRDREQQINEMVGHMPDWFMKSGYFAVHPGLIHNPVQWNMPGMLEQIARPFASVFGDVPYTNAAELWGPATTFASEAFTGVDPQGRALPGSGGNAEKALLALFAQTAPGQLEKKAAKNKKEQAATLPPPPVKSGFSDPVSAALSRERAGLNFSVFENDGFWNTYGLALFRSAVPRQVNRAAGEARYWRDLSASDPAAFHKHEIDAVTQMVKRQAQVLGEQVPGDVVRSVDTIAETSIAIEDWKRDHKGEPAPNEKTVNQIVLDSLIKQGRIPKGKRDEWMKKITDDVTSTDINATHVDLLNAGGGKAWKTWIDRVNKVDAYASLKFNGAVASLNANRLGDYAQAAKAPREQKWAYGRQSERILQHAKELAAVVTTGGEDAALAQQEWISYVNQNDKEITVNGVTYPSPFAYEYASKTPQEQQRALATISRRKPSTLTALQTQLLTGTRPDPVVTKAWATLYGWLKDAKSKLSFGEKLPNGTKAYWEDYIASKVPAFKAELNMERAPLAKRLQTYVTIKNSPNAAAWNDLLSAAAKRYDQFAKVYTNEDGQPVKSQITEAWKLDVPKVKAYLEKKYPAFTSELAVYTGATGPKDADAKVTNFLDSLVAP